MEPNKDLNYLLESLDKMQNLNDLEFFSKKQKNLFDTNPQLLDFIGELSNYLPSHMREKFYKLAIITAYILGAGNDLGRETDYVEASEESINEVRRSPQWLIFDKIREVNPHFADLLELAQNTVEIFTKSQNEKQKTERYKVDPDDMWEIIENIAKAYWIEIKKVKQISEES